MNEDQLFSIEDVKAFIDENFKDRENLNPIERLLLRSVEILIHKVEKLTAREVPKLNLQAISNQIGVNTKTSKVKIDEMRIDSPGFKSTENKTRSPRVTNSKNSVRSPRVTKNNVNNKPMTSKSKMNNNETRRTKTIKKIVPRTSVTTTRKTSTSELFNSPRYYVESHMPTELYQKELLPSLKSFGKM